MNLKVLYTTYSGSHAYRKARKWAGARGQVLEEKNRPHTTLVSGDYNKYPNSATYPEFKALEKPGLIMVTTEYTYRLGVRVGPAVYRVVEVL